MALAAILMEQTVVMCLFLLLGYLMGKLGWVTQKGSGEITNLLVRIVVPAAIINSFFVERTPERLLQFLSLIHISSRKRRRAENPRG